MPFGASEKKPIIGCINIEDHNTFKDSATSVQNTVSEFIGESKNKQRNVEEMSSADQQQKPSAYAYDGPGGRRRRSQRLENRRKGNLIFIILSIPIGCFNNNIHLVKVLFPTFLI